MQEKRGPVKSMAPEAVEGDSRARPTPHLFSWLSPTSCPDPRSLPCSCPWRSVSETVLGTEQCPIRQQRARGRARANHEWKACEQAWRWACGAVGPWRLEGGLSAGGSGRSQLEGEAGSGTQPAGPGSAEPWPLTGIIGTRPPEAPGTARGATRPAQNPPQ